MKFVLPPTTTNIPKVELPSQITANDVLNYANEMMAFILVSGGIIAHVQALVRGTALLPCDLSASAPNDSVVLVVWYKDEHTPIYR